MGVGQTVDGVGVGDRGMGGVYRGFIGGFF